jgi:hypothetical protein
LPPFLSLLLQDTLCLVAFYPFPLDPFEEFGPLSDFDLIGGGDNWNARQNIVSCSLFPTVQMEEKIFHREVSLVLFSTLEPICFIPDGCIQRNSIPMLYKLAASQLPTLYVCQWKRFWAMSS